MIPVADLALLYDLGDGFAVQAVVGAATVPVHFRAGDQEALGGERLVRGYSIRFRTSDLPALARGDSVSVAATSYRVLDVRQLEHGDEAVARLTKV